MGIVEGAVLFMVVMMVLVLGMITKSILGSYQAWLSKENSKSVSPMDFQDQLTEALNRTILLAQDRDRKRRKRAKSEEEEGEEAQDPLKPTLPLQTTIADYLNEEVAIFQKLHQQGGEK
jgi:hypothetical protein